MAYDGSQAFGIAAGGGATTNNTLNVGSNSDRILLVQAVIRRTPGTPQSITSMAYGPLGSETAMTADASYTSSYWGDECQMFTLVNPASGSNNLKIVASSDGDRFDVLATWYSGFTAISSATLVHEKNVGSDGQPTVTVATTTGHTVVAVANVSAPDSGGSAAGSATLRFNGTGSGTLIDCSMHVLDVVAASSSQAIGMSGLVSGGYWDIWGFSLTPASTQSQAPRSNAIFNQMRAQ